MTNLSSEQPSSTVAGGNLTGGDLTGGELWAHAREILRQRIKPHNFEMWLEPLTCDRVSESKIHLRAPNRYIKEWFEDNYQPVVLRELRQLTNREYQILFTLTDNDARVSGQGTAAPEPGEDPTWSFDLNDRYSFTNFVVGPSNQLAYAAAHAAAEKPAGKYNPLFIYGGVGLGKTHLLYAMANEIHRRQPHLRILYLSSEQFLNEYIAHVRTNRIEDFRKKYRNKCEVLLMDDIQFIAGKDRTQDEFFHTFNSLYDLQRQIVLTSDKYPHEIPDLEERLRTRFQWGLIADIQQPELETRVAILKRKAEHEYIQLSDEVAFFLANQVRSNVRELEGSLIRLAALASLQHTEINVAFAQETLKNILVQKGTGITVERIQKDVASYFNVKLGDLKSHRRNKTIALPRQIAMYLSRELTGASFPDIGHRFGGKDHSTVISACRKIALLVDKDLSVRSTVETLQRQLQL